MHQELLRFLKGKGTAAALLGVAVFSYYYKNRENKTSIRDRHLLTEQQRTVLKTGISLITLAWLFNKVRPYYKPFIYFATAIHQFQNRLDKLAPTAEHLRTLLCSYQRLMEPNQQNHRQLEQIKRIGTTAASRLEAIAANEYIVPLSPTMKTMLKEILQSKKIRNHLDPSNTNRLEFLRSQRISGMTKEMSPFYVFGGPSGVGKTASLSELSDILTHSFGIRTVLHDLSAADKWDKEAKVLIGDIEKADRFAGTRGVVAIITIHEFDNIFNSSLTDETNKQNALKNVGDAIAQSSNILCCICTTQKINVVENQLRDRGCDRRVKRLNMSPPSSKQFLLFALDALKNLLEIADPRYDHELKALNEFTDEEVNSSFLRKLKQHFLKELNLNTAARLTLNGFQTYAEIEQTLNSTKDHFNENFHLLINTLKKLSEDIYNYNENIMKTTDDDHTTTKVISWLPYREFLTTIFVDVKEILLYEKEGNIADILSFHSFASASGIEITDDAPQVPTPPDMSRQRSGESSTEMAHDLIRNVSCLRPLALLPKLKIIQGDFTPVP